MRDTASRIDFVARFTFHILPIPPILLFAAPFLAWELDACVLVLVLRVPGWKDDLFNLGGFRCMRNVYVYYNVYRRIECEKRAK